VDHSFGRPQDRLRGMQTRRGRWRLLRSSFYRGAFHHVYAADQANPAVLSREALAREHPHAVCVRCCPQPSLAEGAGGRGEGRASVSAGDGYADTVVGTGSADDQSERACQILRPERDATWCPSCALVQGPRSSDLETSRNGESSQAVVLSQLTPPSLRERHRRSLVACVR